MTNKIHNAFVKYQTFENAIVARTLSASWNSCPVFRSVICPTITYAPRTS